MAIATIVSKAHLLQGIDDDDDIDMPTHNFVEQEGFNDIVIKALGGNTSSQEQLELLREAYAEGWFSTTVQAQPLEVKEPLHMQVDESRWNAEARNRQLPRPQSPERQKALREHIKELLNAGCIEPCQAPAYSQVHLVKKKPNGKWRFCLDFRSSNEVVTPFSWPIPSIKLMLDDRLGEKKPCFFATMDLTSGYFQAPIAPEARAYTAFRTDSDVFLWKRVPMGLKGAASYFQEATACVIGPDLLYNGV
jgi:hypothetical protein